MGSLTAYDGRVCGTCDDRDVALWSNRVRGRRGVLGSNEWLLGANDITDGALGCGRVVWLGGVIGSNYVGHGVAFC